MKNKLSETVNDSLLKSAGGKIFQNYITENLIYNSD